MTFKFMALASALAMLLAVAVDRAEAGDRAGARHAARLVIGHVGGVDEAPALIDVGVVEQPFDRPRARPGEAVLDFLDLFGGVDAAGEAEAATDLLPGQCTSLKNSVNSELAEKIALATGKKNDQRSANASFEFDFTAGKAIARPMQLYIHGHYIKLARGYCQSRWHCSECGGKGSGAPAGGKSEGTVMSPAKTITSASGKDLIMESP